MREQTTQRISAKGFLLGVLAGGVAGGLTALLYAPKSGRELRRDIGRKKDMLVKDADRYYENTKKRVGSYIDEGKLKAENLVKDVRQKAENIGAGAGNLYSQGKEFISEETAKLKDAVKAGVDAYNDERKHS